MKKANIIFPHHLLYQDLWQLSAADNFLVEELLFFRLYPFHKQKIAFHRASMKAFADYWANQDISFNYVDSEAEISDIRKLVSHLSSGGYTHISCLHPSDNWLEQRLEKSCEKEKIELNYLDNPCFLNSHKDVEQLFPNKRKRFFQTSFYKDQRKTRKLLIDPEGNPEGGDWTYDKDNRKSWPKKKQPPTLHYPEATAHWTEACAYVREHFPDNPSQLSESPIYPYTRDAALSWFQQFLDFRFHEFGLYEDAIVAKEKFLNHSVISPLINVGLLNPQEVIGSAISYASKNDVPINSTEGFVRQILGWREFIRGMYVHSGVKMRTRNYWEFKHPLPSCFYTGETGVEPVDVVIKRVLSSGYCHHIERLMILGNFMLLCEIHPKEVYRWFMELFIDAYDWVMVPNVYGMSLYADGGIFATKPYISGSNYLLKMSDFKKGPWCEIWDGLYWRFINKHRSFFKSNPRLALMVSTFDKFDDEKRQKLLNDAEQFLQEMHAKQ